MTPDIAATSPPAGPKDFVELLQAYPHATMYDWETDYTYVVFRTINRMFRYRHNMQEFTEVDWKTKAPLARPDPKTEFAAPVLHPTTFEYLKPTDEQVKRMTSLRHAAKTYAHVVDSLVPAGPDKTYVLRKIREIGMWVNVAVTRQADGTPRT